MSGNRSWLHYAFAFRFPGIVSDFEKKSEEIWWLCEQEWAMLHEENLAANASANITVRIPHSQTLDTTSLEHDLPELAEGRPASAMVLALRSVIEVAHGWEN